MLATMRSQKLHISRMIVMLASLLISCSSLPLYKSDNEEIVYPPHDYHHPPLVNLSLFRYHINSNACQEHDTPIQVIIMVKSHVGNQHKRQLIRIAYSASMLEAHGIRRVFVLAMLDNDKENNTRYKSISSEQIAEENRRNGDLIQINYFEHYDFLTYKTLMGMKWAVTNCKAMFLVSQDDDVFVDVYQLLSRIQSLTGEDKNSMYGYMMGEGDVIRDRNMRTEYEVTIEQYAPDYYPNYLSGIFMFYSLDTAKLLLDNAENLTYLNIEDAFISGVVAEKVGVKLRDFTGITPLCSSPNCCRDQMSDVIFQCEETAAEIKIQPSIEKVKMWSEHVEYCHRTKQCKPYLDSRNLEHLVCV